jgi:protein gp37
LVTTTSVKISDHHVSDKSKIEWTDATWNPIRACSKVSPGCQHCYAETFAERWRGVPGQPYVQAQPAQQLIASLHVKIR